jgi:hypothetical protein
VIDGIVVEDEPLIDLVINKASSARYILSPVLSPDSYACLDSGATGHLFKTRPPTSSFSEDKIVPPTWYISASGNSVVTSGKLMTGFGPYVG